MDYLELWFSIVISPVYSCAPLLPSKPSPGVKFVVFYDQKVYELISLSIYCNNTDMRGRGSFTDEDLGFDRASNNLGHDCGCLDVASLKSNGNRRFRQS